MYLLSVQVCADDPCYLVRITFPRSVKEETGPLGGRGEPKGA